MIKPIIPHRKWHSSEIDMVRHLIEVQDHSDLQVAERFHVSKNAIISLRHRYGIKHSDTYVRINKPVTKPAKKPFIKAALVDKKCAYCGVKFQAAQNDIKRFCSTKHAYDFHGNEQKLARAAAPTSPKKAWLNPPVDSPRCHAKGCDTFAVPKHKVCYQHA